MSEKTTIGDAIGQMGRTALDPAPFSFDARAVTQLGRESISSSITALVELVKNAYDADATRVCLRFCGLGTKEAMLVIEDDGNGMDYDTLVKCWLLIGTPNKRDFGASGKRTPKNRVVSGEKGLGRLGLDRLCRKTTVQTVEQSKPPIELVVDWSQYEQAHRRVEEIRHPISKLDHLNFDPVTHEPIAPFTHGTRLLLEGLKDVWSIDVLAELRSELSLLLSPFQRHQEFVIHIDTGSFAKEVDGELQPALYVLDDAFWEVVGTIDANDRVTIEMTSPREKFGYREDPKPWKDFVKGLGEKPACGPLELRFYYYPRSEDTADSLIAAKQRDAFLQAHQGIRIYRDGVRVKPYGDPKGAGDWLQLSLRKTRSPAAVTRTGDWRVAYYQVVGAVFITHEGNPQLGDQTNREGLLNNLAFRDLMIFALRVVRYFEDKHSAFMASRRAPAVPTEVLKKEAADATSSARAALDKLRHLITSAPDTKDPAPIDAALNLATKTLEVGLQASQKTIEAAERDKQEAIAEKNMLSNLASLGILAATFGHETLNDADSLVKFTMRLKDGITSGDFSAFLDPRGLTNISDAAKRVDSFGRFSLGNVRASKRVRQKFPLLKLVRDIFEQFRPVIVVQRNIDVQLPPKETLEGYIDAFPTDWESIFANLISNAVWALDKKPRNERIIRVGFRLDNRQNECHITFEDSGHGLEAGTEEAVFKPGFTTKRDAEGRDIGTGMGLTLVRAFVEEHSRGRVRAFCTGELGGARFEIAAPSISAV